MNEDKVKHLEMIQSIISRMASNSFLIKGWSITIVVAILGLANKDSIIILITIFPVVMFWMLDIYYLSQEKKFRELYNRVRVISNEDIDFDMSIDQNSSLKNFITCFLSPSIFIFHIFLLVAVFIVTSILYK